MASVIKVLNTVDGQFPKTVIRKGKVKAGSVESVKPGYLVIKDSGNAGYLLAAANGTASTAEIIGIATSTSNDTAAADGEFEYVAGNLICEMVAQTPGNLAATALYDQYTLDVSSGSYLLDENDTTNGFIRLLDYDNTTDGNCIVQINCMGA